MAPAKEQKHARRQRAGGCSGTLSVCAALAIAALSPANGGLLVAVAIAAVLTAAAVVIELGRSRRLLTSALSSMTDAVVETDAGGKVVFLNTASEALSGWKRKEATGRPFEEVFRFTNLEGRGGKGNSLREVITLGRTVDLPGGVVLWSIEGAARRVQGSAAPVRDRAGHVKGMTVLLRDVTSKGDVQEKRRAAEIAEAYARLARWAVENLNSALTIITGHAELIRGSAEGKSDSSLRASAEEILTASAQISVLTNELMAFGGRGVQRASQAPPAQEAARGAGRGPVARPKPAMILIVEHDKGVRLLLSAILRAQGYAVLEASGSVDAAAIVAEELNRLDLIVADAAMCAVGEHGLIERLKMLRPELKILYVSGGEDVPSQLRPSSGNGVQFLSKPFSPQGFLERVESLLSS